MREDLQATVAQQKAHDQRVADEQTKRDYEAVTAGVAKMNLESAREREQSDAKYADLQRRANEAVQNEQAAHKKTAADRAASSDAARAKAAKDAEKLAKLEMEVENAKASKHASIAAARALKDELDKTKAAAAEAATSAKKRSPSVPKKKKPIPAVCFLCNGGGHVAANCIAHGHTNKDQWRRAAQGLIPSPKPTRS